MMTVTAIMAGLLPILWSPGTGWELMKRIAVPMVSGMVSSTMLTLIVIPAIYGVVKGWRLPNKVTAPTPDDAAAAVPAGLERVKWEAPASGVPTDA
jgi:Cu(I)/Ag(I) efflux system membrane protein CusA/SilA